MSKIPFVLLWCCIVLAGVTPVSGAELTPEQIESIRARMEALKKNLDQHLTSRNSGAGETFSRAAGDPKAAVELYLNAHKLVNFDRENRPEADFRAWRDGQSDNLKDAAFVESLQMQLSYLALSCRAAETDDMDAVFSSLLGYVDSLSYMQELPHASLTSSVANSVFAKAYYLERLLGDNSKWEPIPFNIDGIYDRVILPHLRKEKPEALMNAWDKRIEQQTRIVQMIESHREKEMRGLSRDEQRRARTNQKRQGGILGSLERDEFQARTLPKLRWSRLKDLFLHVDEVDGAKQMLDFVEENLTHELGEVFFDEFNSLLSEVGIGSNRLREVTSDTTQP